MNAKTFDEFVNRQQEADAFVNWEEIRAEWIRRLDDLYLKIESFLTKYISLQQIRLEYRRIDLNEQGIGAYIARRMVLRIGRQEVGLVPVGTLLIGAKGRVDVVGPAGKAEIMLVNGKLNAWKPRVTVTTGVGGKLSVPPSEAPQNIEWEWRIVTRPPERRFIEITQESFFQLIMEVSNV